MNLRERMKRDGYTHDEIEDAIHDIESRAYDERKDREVEEQMSPRAWPFPSRAFQHASPGAPRFNPDNIEDAPL